MHPCTIHPYMHRLRAPRPGVPPPPPVYAGYIVDRAYIHTGRPLSKYTDVIYIYVIYILLAMHRNREEGSGLRLVAGVC